MVSCRVGIFGTRQVTHLPFYGPGEISLKPPAQPKGDLPQSMRGAGMTDTADRRILLVRVFPKPCSRYPKTVRLANHDPPDKPDVHHRVHHFGQAATRCHASCFFLGWWLQRGRDGKGEQRGTNGLVVGADGVSPAKLNKTLATAQPTHISPHNGPSPRPPTCRHKQQP